MIKNILTSALVVSGFVSMANAMPTMSVRENPLFGVHCQEEMAPSNGNPSTGLGLGAFMRNKPGKVADAQTFATDPKAQAFVHTKEVAKAGWSFYIGEFVSNAKSRVIKLFASGLKLFTNSKQK